MFSNVWCLDFYKESSMYRQSLVKQHLLKLQVNNTIHFYTVPDINVGN